MYVIEQHIPPAPALILQQMCWRMECKEEGKTAAICLKMKGYVEQLERLSYVLPQDLSVGLILNGLTSDFAGFVRNYNMHNMRKTIDELHDMLIEYEKAKEKGKANGKGKDKQVYIPKPKNLKPSAKEHPAKDDICHHCKEVGHWKRNCPVYLAELLKKKRQVVTASSSGIFTIESFSFPNKSWVYDIGCGIHICITKHGIRGARKLEQRALYLYVGNGVLAQVEAIGGKMTRKPFSHHTKRATDLLGIIHTDMCGPLRHVSRQGASYFITFTDEYSHYGYVYLLKHKHEVFETFKVFKNEVENQLGKTIKALRSDRGGKYISQEFKDYLKSCGIVQQLTPSYTPQHNGVSERRNRTLLDVVRSMMNLTTLP
ncbi:retrotransposon protein, putative, ty1-copia subclass, partial [Tanacetum coccineum]